MDDAAPHGVERGHRRGRMLTRPDEVHPVARANRTDPPADRRAGGRAREFGPELPLELGRRDGADLRPGEESIAEPRRILWRDCVALEAREETSCVRVER